MYVTGGITNKGYSSEVWKYDLDTSQWQQAQVRATNVSFSCQTKEVVMIGWGNSMKFRVAKLRLCT